MKFWIFAVLIAMPTARAQAAEDGSARRFAKAVEHLDTVGPRLMQGVLDSLQRECPPADLSAPCAFLAIARDQARFQAEWQRRSIGDLGDGGRIDEAFARATISRVALRHSFSQAADEIRRLISEPRFDEFQKPLLSAWMEDGNSVARVLALGRNMKCANDRRQCRAIHAGLLRAGRLALREWGPALSLLPRLEADPRYSPFFALRESLDLIAQADPMEVRWWLESPEFAKVPAVQIYLERLSTFLRGQNLGAGDMNRFKILEILWDLRRFAPRG